MELEIDLALILYFCHDPPGWIANHCQPVTIIAQRRRTRPANARVEHYKDYWDEQGTQLPAVALCKASSGQFSNEVVISGVEHDDTAFSMFANRKFVECDEELGDSSVDALLQVIELARDGQLILVRLPGNTQANGGAITVRADQLDECSEPALERESKDAAVLRG